MNCSIYVCKNKINNKVYIGQTWSTIGHRFSQHLCDKRITYFHSALKKYGKDNFNIECVAICSNQEIADYLEISYIFEYDSRNKNKGYNLTSGGSTGKHSEETKRKISIANIGNKYGCFSKGIPRIIKNRCKTKKPKKSKFSDETILAIKNDPRPYSKVIYELYRVSNTQYYRIKKGKK